jgi:hypothetical protein
MAGSAATISHFQRKRHWNSHASSHFLPTHKLASKQRTGARVTRRYGAARTPYARLLAIEDFDPATKVRLRALHQQLNPFQLRRDIERQFKEIESVRLLGS